MEDPTKNEPKENLDPVEQSVHVDCPIDEAFRLFTERIGEWLPVEREDRDWGKVTEWEPPNRVTFTWNPGSVEVEFSVEGDGTRVSITHRDWHVAGGEVPVMLAAA
jgi:hypothetical protein